MTGAGAIAQRYARALFSLGEERGSAAALLAELDEITRATLESEALGRVLLTPLHPRSERRGVVGALAQKLRLGDEVRAFVLILVDENRTRLLPEIRDALRELVERAAGRVKARVISARSLQSREIQRLERALSRRVDAQVSIETEVDEGLIGGVVARVGDLLLDGSLRTQLDALRGSLRKGSA